METNRRILEHRSKKPVRKFDAQLELSLPLSQKAQRILAVLGTDGVASEAVQIAGCAKSTVSYWKDRFIKAGALRLKVNSIVKYYELTSYGSRLLTGSDGALTPPVVLEDHAFKFRVLKRESFPVDWEKLGEPRNWRKLGVLIGTIRVELNLGKEHTVVIHPGQLKGLNTDELEMEAARIIERTRLVLEDKFGMAISEFGMPLHRPRWRIYRPECSSWISSGTVEVDGVGALDHSPTHDKNDPLSNKPHLEYSDKELATTAANFPVAYDSSKRLAVAAVEFPVVLKNIESKLDSLAEKINILLELHKIP